MATINGDNLILSVYDAVALAYKPTACITSNALNQTLEIVDSKTKCNPGVITKTPTSKSYDLSIDGEYIDTTSVGGSTTLASHDFLKTLYEAKTLVTWRLTTGLADTTHYYGTAYIADLALTAPAGEITTFTASFSGSGEIVTVDPI